MLVNFYATFRLQVGQKTVEVAVEPGSSVRQLVEKVVQCYPRLSQGLLNTQGDLQTQVHVFVNRRELDALPDQINTILKSEDIVDIFPPVAGGSP